MYGMEVSPTLISSVTEAVDGMSASEIALHLGLTRNTVLSHLHRLRLRMRRYDDERGEMP